MNITPRRRGDPAGGTSPGGGEPGGLRDLGGLEAFYRRHVEDMTRFVGRRFDDPHTVADVVADIFLAVVDSGDAYRSAARDERAWLYGVARHVVNAEYRRKKRVDVLNSRIAGRRLLDQDDIARVEDRILAENSGRAMLDAMSALPERQRAVLELVAVDELSVAEAAKALGISSVTARVNLHRARTKLRASAAADAEATAPVVADVAARSDGSTASVTPPASINLSGSKA